MFLGQSGREMPNRNAYGYLDLGLVYFVRDATQNCDRVFPVIHNIPPVCGVGTKRSGPRMPSEQ